MNGKTELRILLRSYMDSPTQHNHYLIRGYNDYIHTHNANNNKSYLMTHKNEYLDIKLRAYDQLKHFLMSEYLLQKTTVTHDLYAVMGTKMNKLINDITMIYMGLV